MRRTRASKRPPVVESSSDSEDDIPLKKLNRSAEKRAFDQEKLKKQDISSSSESDIENYLQPAEKLDLNSSFFNIRKKNEEFNKIEKTLFNGIRRLSDSESDDMNNEADLIPHQLKQKPEQAKLISDPGTSGTKLNFQQLEEYTKNIEEAKKHVEKYNAKKKAAENNLDVLNLLAAGESKQITLDNIKPEDLHSSDFESCESEQEDWEEVKIKENHETKEKSLIPQQNLQIIIDMPDTCRKKKGVDLLAAMKRRLNRIRKENQVYVHQVHLLCWIAHGNYVNEVINNMEVLGLALSLLPSDKCYPSERTDLNYLEQIVQWYKKTIKLVEKGAQKNFNLVEMLQEQITRKEAYNKKMFVYIFVAILRGLGIQCRLILSFQVEPLRPPASELHSLAKEETKNNNARNAQKKKEPSVGKSNVLQKGNSSSSSKSRVLKVDQNRKAKTSNATDNSEKEEVGIESKGKPKKDDSSDKPTKEHSGKNTKSNTATAKKGKKDETKKNIEGVAKRNSKSNTVTANKGKEDKKSNNEKKVAINSSTNTVTTKRGKQEEIKSMNEKKVEKTNSRSKSAEKLENRSQHDIINVPTKSRHTKSVNTDEKNTHRSKNTSSTQKEIIKIKLPAKAKTKEVPQLDGIYYSSDEGEVSTSCNMQVDLVQNIPQLDGADDDKKNKINPRANKPNLKKLSKPVNTACVRKKHPSRLKSIAEVDSENEFRSRSPFTKKNVDSPKSQPNQKINLRKLKTFTSEVKKDAKFSPKKQVDVRNDIIGLIKGRIVEQKHVDRSRLVKKRKPPVGESDSDSDYMPEPIKKKHHESDSDIDYFVPKPKVKQRIKVQRNQPGIKIVSSDSDIDKSGKKKKRGINIWAEVFLESEEKWISVDVVQGQVHCVNELYTRATHPVTYVVAWSNNNSIKDVTKRYCTNFSTITRKLRIDSKWWDETLKPYLGLCTARDKEEDDDLNRQQLDQPLPKSIAEYKNHPLYSLRRHLLKFEEIYPPNVQPLGYVRGEPVYPRNCVYVCRSRDIWLKEAKVVKPGEKPYKIVKARPKYDKLSNKVITDQMLEIFGEWQTSDYEPPVAENGIVPRNAFGNVDLFKPTMLPKGTVHLKLPGLNKICRRMNIDCASAIIGFDFHSGWSVPLYDGFIVCTEFTDTVIAAWELEQEEIERKENEKIEKRVYGNWKKLIKGLLIRERLKARYDFGNPSTSGEGGKEKKKPKGPKFCTKKRRIYSGTESESDGA